MKRILLIFINDLKRRIKSPVGFLLMMLIPLVMTAIIGMIFAPPGKSANELPKISVLIVDHDNNFASKLIMGAFSSKESKGMFKTTNVTEPEGKKLISKGKASALVIIPPKFTERILDAEKNQIILIKNPSEQFLPSIVEEFLNTLSVMISGIVQVFEPEIKSIKSAIDTPIEDISMLSLTPFMEIIKNKMVAARTYLFPMFFEIKKEETKDPKAAESQKPDFNVFALIMPGMAIMFLLFTIESFMREILTERQNGITRRMMFSPIRPIELIIARIVSGWLSGIIAFILLFIVSSLIFGISWGNYLYLFILIAVISFWIASFFTLLNSFFKNKNQAGAVTSPIILIFSVFGGSILPIEQMPRAFQMVSQFSINHWFISGIQKITNGEFPIQSVAIILATSLILFIAAIFALDKKITV